MSSENYSLLAYLDEQRQKEICDGKKEDSDAVLQIMTDLHRRMVSLKEYATTKLDTIIKTQYPWHTNCGKKYVAQVDRMVAQLLYKMKLQLHPYEIFVLYAAIIYHHTVLKSPREPDVEILKELYVYMPNRDFEKVIRRIAEAQIGSHEKTEELSTTEPLTHMSVQQRVDIRALTSLLRFADAISDTVARIDPELLNDPKLPPEKKASWKFSDCVKYSAPVLAERKIDIEIQVTTRACLEKVLVPNKNGKHTEIQFFDYLIGRLDLIDSERRNCCPNFRYFVSIDTLIVTIKLLNDKDEEIKRAGVPFLIEINEKYFQNTSFRTSFYMKNAKLGTAQKRDKYFKKL